MGFKETNREREIGIIPSQGADPIPVGKIPDGGTQVAKSADATDSIEVIHEVAGGKTFYVSHGTLSVRNISEISQYGRLDVTNGEDTLQHIIALIYKPGGDGSSVSLSFMPPLEFPAGWKIRVYSGGAGAIVYGFVHGYEA